MMWDRRMVRSGALLVSVLVGACAPGDDGPAGDPADVPQPYYEVAPGPGGPIGVVLETMNAGGYTYARLDAPEAEIWAAGPMTDLVVGDTVYLAGASNMGVFKSDELDRMWDEIYFVNAFQKASETDGTFEATVTETMNAAGYSYVQITVGEDLVWMVPAGSEEPLVWLAGPETELSVGDVVSWQGGSVMREFRSNSLDRTFAEIVFVGSFTVVN